MNFGTISVRDLDRYVGDDRFYIVDMRSPTEFRNGHIRGAINIPGAQMQQFAYYDSEKEFILYCSRGGTSMQAARSLSAAGYRVWTVIGGIHMYSGPNFVRGR